jgi:hypothetical protein
LGWITISERKKMLIYCPKCEKYNSPEVGICIFCNSILPDPDRYDWVGILFAELFSLLMLWGAFWAAYEFMIFRG